MKHKFSKYLNQPYPFSVLENNTKRNIFFSLFVTAFLLIFKPFGLSVYGYERSYIIIGYGLIIWLTLLFTDFIAYRFFKSIFSEKKWTVASQIIWAITQLCIIGITCFSYAIAIDAFPQNISSFLKIESYVLLCSIIPIIIIVLVKQNYLLRQNSQEALILDNELHQSKNANSEYQESNKIVFTGDNQNEQLALNSDDIVYITSQDNYFEIVWQENDKVKKQLFRGTLSKAEETVQSFPFLFRSHRAYIVNLKKVASIDGNAQGYRLKLNVTSEVVPVSRSKGPSLYQLLQTIT